jgi:hypothetical protein
MCRTYIRPLLQENIPLYRAKRVWRGVRDCSGGANGDISLDEGGMANFLTGVGLPGPKRLHVAEKKVEGECSGYLKATLAKRATVGPKRYRHDDAGCPERGRPYFFFHSLLFLNHNTFIILLISMYCDTTNTLLSAPCESSRPPVLLVPPLSCVHLYYRHSSSHMSSSLLACNVTR